MGPASASSCSVCGESLGAKGVCFACLLRAALDEPGTPEAALLFDDFEIVRREDGSLWELGRGGMGVTYRATEKPLHRDVALKVINPHGSDAIRERFLREARAAAALRHPNVAGVFRFGALADADRCYCAMELVEGETLEALVRREGPLKLETALEIALQVTRALMAAAERGLVHRDLKPANIMLAQNGGAPSKIEVKVIDFGLAKATTDVSEEMKLTRGEFVGTPAFASPEQFAGGSIDARTDIYALGVTLWFALSGRLPSAGRTIEEIRQNQTRGKLPLEQLQGLPRRVIELLRSCLAIDPEQRPASARKLLEALESCRAKSIPRRSTVTLAVTAIAVFALGIAAFLFWRNRAPDLSPATSVLEKSIAVLPFENRSADPDNAYISDGIQDEILTRLSKVADLRVISRTSTQHYKSSPENLPKIARELGVAYILEGSVQKNAATVRVNVQLIKAANDSHVWADIFDRKLTDILSVESEIAKAIADQLRAKLTGQEEQVIAAKPTDNPEAYDAYLRGLAYSLKPANTTANTLGAQKYLREAVRLDPKFARAWALLSSVDSIGYRTVSVQRTDALREEARQAAETAVSLQPDLGEAVLARGYYHYGCLKDYDTAIRYFEQARQLLPNDSRIAESLAYVTRRRGQWEQSESYFNEAERLDVRNANLLTQHAISYMRVRRFPEALRKLDQVLNITPDDVHIIAYKASIAQAQGNLPESARILAPLRPAADDPTALETQVYQAILERRPASIIPRLQQILEKPDPALGYLNADLRYWLGWAQEIAGDRAAAQKNWQQARSELESYLKEEPENFNILSDLALTNMGLGDKTAAFAFAERAIAANPLEEDAVSGPSPIETLARVAARLGEPDRAIAALQQLLSIPAVTDTVAPITPALLRLDPTFDALRNEPRFEKILVEAQQRSAGPTSLVTQVPEKSIAVLPFENLSEEKANEYFAAGIQDEILTRLAAIRDLKVISRTSTAKYKSKPDDLKKIAWELGVSTILEGTVQKSGDKVRINVQLIRAATDSHLWAETFDRNLTDIFAVESEVAKTIADRLQAKLTGAEEQIIAAKATDNPEAYDAYLRGLAYSLKTANTTANATNAQKYLREAVRLDPKFALAWALLSYVEARAYRTEFLPPTVALREEARQAAETALGLQPNLGEAVLAKGFYHYACLRDYETAVLYFEQARPLLPNSSRIPESLAYVTRKQGQWDRSESYFKEAERLDPRNVSLLTQHALSYKDRRMFPEASRKFEQILNIAPDDVDTIVEKAVIAQAEGDLPRASALLAPLHIEANDPNAFETQVYQAILERRTDAIIPRLQEIVAKPDPALGYTNGELRFWLGWAQEVTGDRTAAQENWRTARQELESFLKEHPEDHILLGDLALTNACLGDKAAAFAFAEKAMAAVPVEKDAVSGPAAIEILARAAARLGETDRALAALPKLMTTSYSGALGPGAPLTQALLRLDPMFDPLRKDPRFEKLLVEEEKTVPVESAPTGAPEKSIAVLPFDNLSEEKANEYFAAGVQDEILTRLAAVRDLKVISRTSTGKYKSKPDNLRKVAQELGVSNILEGTVQRYGDKVRINVQLIDARADTHLWAKSYDRELKDVFAVESEVAQEIAESLRVKLSAAQSDAMANAPTNDTEAYDLFLRGEYEFHQAGISQDAGAAADRADAFYRRALARDPNFVKPAAQLARSRLYRHWYTSPLAPEELEEVKSIIDRTLTLAPKLPEAHLALGLFYYWGHRQYEMALAEFKRTLDLQPNNVDAWAYCAWINRRRGEWERSLAASQRAQELDPHDASIPQNVGVTYLALRQWKEAERTELRALALDPQNTVAAVILAHAHLSGTGEAGSARRALNDFPEAVKALTTSLYGRRGASSGGEVAAIIGVWVYLDVIDRRFTDAFQAFEKAAGNDERGRLQLLAGRVALRVLAGQGEAAKSMGEEVLPLLEARLRERPDDTFAMTALSWVYLALGRGADALRLSTQAADSISLEKDTLDGAVFQNGLAQIEARSGAPEEAVKRLRHLLSIPAGHRISRARLKTDPAWDPIRGRPDFQELLSGPEQIGPNK